MAVLPRPVRFEACASSGLRHIGALNTAGAHSGNTIRDTDQVLYHPPKQLDWLALSVAGVVAVPRNVAPVGTATREGPCATMAISRSWNRIWED